jgi:aspartokinase/homoserine dehydrogenase 1
LKPSANEWHFITQALLSSLFCIGILNSDANAEEAINKAFEIEIAQNKVEPLHC